jgi:methyl-accepting chemotaxis protein
MILAGVAALMTALIGWLITRSITTPTRKLVEGADKMAAGRLQLQARHRQQGRSRPTGDFGARHAGRGAAHDQRRRHVNNTLDAVINPLNVTARYVDDIAKGVIPPVITDSYNGDFNVIKNNLNNMVRMMSDLLAQTDIIIRGAADGQLDKRANADLFVGGWNQLVTGVNEAITNIVNPLNVTADYVDRIAKGTSRR